MELDVVTSNSFLLFVLKVELEHKDGYIRSVQIHCLTSNVFYNSHKQITMKLREQEMCMH